MHSCALTICHALHLHRSNKSLQNPGKSSENFLEMRNRNSILMAWKIQYGNGDTIFPNTYEFTKKSFILFLCQTHPRGQFFKNLHNMLCVRAYITHNKNSWENTFMCLPLHPFKTKKRDFFYNISSWFVILLHASHHRIHTPPPSPKLIVFISAILLHIKKSYGDFYNSFRSTPSSKAWRQ